MPTECSGAALEFTGFNGRSVVAAFDGGLITSDAGPLLLGERDRTIGLVERFATCFRDRRRPDLIEHDVRTLVMQPVGPVRIAHASSLAVVPASSSRPASSPVESRENGVSACPSCPRIHAWLSRRPASR